MHTSHGSLKIELFCSEVPRAAENFLALVASGAYDNTEFHRNIKGFMVQGGAPSGSTKGGECIWGGKLADEFSPELKHDTRGIVSMANQGPNTNGSQFFIMYAAQPHLDNQYTIVGKVIHGFDTLDAMERVPVGKKNRPLSSILLDSCVIHANPMAPLT
jgi:peptidyl-prolyl cis-trans isomerase-like 3